MSKDRKASILKNSKILVVDDQQIIRKILARSLASAGFKVTAAEDGLVALERLKEAPFDAMITDIMMPNMDGISLLLESRKTYADMPVLIITGYAKELTTVKARELGASDLLIKPFKNNEIIAALQRTLANRQPQSSSK